MKILFAFLLFGCKVSPIKILDEENPRCISSVHIVSHSAGTRNEAFCDDRHTMTTTLSGETIFVICTCPSPGPQRGR